MSETWTQIIEKIGRRQAEIFMDHSMSYMTILVNGRGIPNVLLSCYYVLTKDKKLEAIEKLPEEEKQRLFLFIKEFAPVEYTKDQYISACRCLHTLEYYIKLK